MSEVEIKHGEGGYLSAESFNGQLQAHVYSKSRYYQYFRDEQSRKGWDDFQDGLDALGMVPVVGEAFDVVNAGISLVRGNYAAAGLSVLAVVPVGGILATTVKQSHHIIPKAVYKEFAGDLVHLMERDGLKI